MYTSRNISIVYFLIAYSLDFCSLEHLRSICVCWLLNATTKYSNHRTAHIQVAHLSRSQAIIIQKLIYTSVVSYEIPNKSTSAKWLFRFRYCFFNRYIHQTDKLKEYSIVFPYDVAAPHTFNSTPWNPQQSAFINELAKETPNAD